MIELNEGAERMLGVRREQALRRALADLLAAGGVRPPDLAELAGELSEDPSRLLDRELELTASGPDGRSFAAELTVARAGVDSPLFIVWIRDVSERRAEETESARRFAMLGHGEEIAGIGSWDWDVRTGELRWSDNLFRLFGLSPGAITPTPEHVIERVHADDRERVRRRVETAVATGTLESTEYEIVPADGAVRRVQSIVAPVEAGHGATRHFLGTLQDVTERRQIAREIAGHIALEEGLAAWASLEDGPGQLLARLGEAMEFAVGVLWLERDDVLIPRSIWSSRPAEASELEPAEQPLETGPGQAPAVEAWLSRQPVLGDRLPEAPAGAGLRGAVALPAVSGDLTFAVMEFYSRDSLEPTETLLRSLTGMGHELGRVFARRNGGLRSQELTVRERQILQLAAHG
ncbi:MAG: PAS domain-containing protein, partial [Actinomycetota bacterium]|nr:PAS domain-containing protein [Actinomycetota bacterium]